MELFPQVSVIYKQLSCTAAQLHIIAKRLPLKVQHLAFNLSWLVWKGLVVLTGTSSKTIS